LTISSLGVWSLVFSALSFAKIADFGIAAGLVRYVARARTGEVVIPALAYVETALLTNFCLYVLLGATIFEPARWALRGAVHGQSLEDARNLLPFAVEAYVLLNLSSVISSALIGFYRADLKSILGISSLTIQIAISWITIRAYGLIGLACAQIAQYLFVVVVGWLIIQFLHPSRERIWVPYNINKIALNEMMGFGLRLQALSLASFLYDPITKFLLSSVAGPAALGLFEAAYRLVFQARSLIIAPAQNLTPMFAAIGYDHPESLKKLYERSTASIVMVATVGSLALIAVSPLVSYLLLKQVQLSYSVWVAILSAGWFVNIAAVPAYLMGIGTGHVRWNIVGSAVSTITSGLLGYSLGRVFGDIGVVSAAAAAAAGGGIIFIAANCRLAGISNPFPSFHIYQKTLAEVRNWIKQNISI
jgi:O-antigen/teichoic acid export membrane protein